MNLAHIDTLKFNIIIDFNNENSFISKDIVILTPSASRVKWTDKENELLLNHVDQHGPKKWKQIAAELKNKTAQQCRDHYFDVLDPRIQNVIWSEEEEEILRLKYEQLGPHWSKIKKFLPGRTTGGIKNYMNSILKRSSIQKEKNKKNHITEFIQSDDIVEESKDFSFLNIESLLNHPTNFSNKI